MTAELVTDKSNSRNDNSRSREEQILSKLLQLIQEDIDAGCKHCSWILSRVFEEVQQE